MLGSDVTSGMEAGINYIDTLISIIFDSLHRC